MTTKTATVAWFNSVKGFGFLKPDDGGADVFVHISALEKAGLDTLHEGQAVHFDTEPDKRGRPSAVNLRVL